MQAITPLMSLFVSNKDISGVMACMLPSSMADCEHSPQLCQTKTAVGGELACPPQVWQILSPVPCYVKQRHQWCDGLHAPFKYGRL
jgi:hypothetical protein